MTARGEILDFSLISITVESSCPTVNLNEVNMFV